MKIIIILIFYICTCIYGSTNLKVKEPVAPKINIPGDTTEKKYNNKEEEKIKKKNDLFVFYVTFIFQDNTILKGMTSFPKDSIMVKHKKKSFMFEKVIKWEDVKSLKIMEWKPRLISKNTNTKYLQYYFYPAKYKFLMKNGKSYYYHKSISYLNSLVLTNDDGSTHVYSFFVDYWKKTGKKSGYWKNAQSAYFYYPFKNPNKKIFKIINFK